MKPTAYRNVALALSLGLLLALVAWFAATGSAWAFQTSSGVTLYEWPDYEGQSEFFDTDDPDLGDNAVGAWAASSIRMQGAARALLFSEPSYQGWVLGVISDTPNLDTVGFDDMVASLKLLAYPTGPGSVTDEFDGTTLDPAWNWNAWTTGATYSLSEQPGQFRLTIPEGDRGYLEDTPYLQRFDMGRGDFSIETRMSVISSTVDNPTGPARRWA